MAGLRASSMRTLLAVGPEILRSARTATLAQDEFARIELPSIDVRVPRIPRHDGGHPLAQIRRDDLGDDERFLPPELVGIAEFEAEHAEDVARHVPGRLRVPAVRDLHDHAEAVWIFGMFDGQTEE